MSTVTSAPLTRWFSDVPESASRRAFITARLTVSIIPAPPEPGSSALARLAAS